jgi:hypothetical protein
MTVLSFVYLLGQELTGFKNLRIVFFFFFFFFFFLGGGGGILIEISWRDQTILLSDKEIR